MKKLIVIFFLLWSAVLHSQIYLPAVPTGYGENVQRIKPLQVLHLPSYSDDLSLHTTDSSSQIRINNGVLQYWNNFRWNSVDSTIVYGVNGIRNVNNTTLELDTTYAFFDQFFNHGADTVQSTYPNGDSIVSIAPKVVNDGDIVLVINPNPDGIFATEGNYIEINNGGDSTNWSRVPLYTGLTITIANDATYKYNGTSWEFVARPAYTTGNKNNVNVHLGTNDSLELTLRTDSIERVKLTAAGELDFLNLVNGDSTILYMMGINGVTGKSSLIPSYPLVAGTGITFTGAHGEIINSSGGGSGFFNFDSALATKTTDDLTQGVTNLYNQTHTGDATGSTALTVVGIRNSSIPALSTGNLRYSGSSFIWDNTTYLSSYTETDPLSVHISDSTAMLLPYLRKIDTTAMLLPYLRKVDTASLSNRINLKLNITDTSIINAEIVQIINALQLKLNISDTAAMLSPYLRSNVAAATYLAKANNLSDVANATTSLNNILPSQTSNSGKVLQTNGTSASWQTVSGGGSTLNNTVNNGIRLLTPAKDSIRTVTGTNGNYFDSTSNTNQLTFNLKGAPMFDTIMGSKTILAFGASITTTWVSNLASGLGQLLVNRGQPSTTFSKLSNGDSSFVNKYSTIQNYNASTIQYIIIGGDYEINELFFSVGVQKYKDTLSAYIDSLHFNKGYPYSSIILASSTPIVQLINGKRNDSLLYYIAANKQVALAKQTGYVDVYTYFNNNGGSAIIQSDSTHPTTTDGQWTIFKAYATAMFGGVVSRSAVFVDGSLNFGANSKVGGTLDFGGANTNKTLIRLVNIPGTAIGGVYYNNTSGAIIFTPRGGGPLLFGSNGDTSNMTTSTAIFGINNSAFFVNKWTAPISFGSGTGSNGNAFLALDAGSTSLRSGYGYAGSGGIAGASALFGRGGFDLYFGIGHDMSDITASNSTFYIHANNLLVVKKRLETSKGANISSAGDLTLGTDGNIFHITGTTTINAILTTNWLSGSEVTLIFDASVTVKNNTTGGASTAVMLLAGGTDFSATSNDVLKLVYDGTSWFEEGRSVN